MIPLSRTTHMLWILRNGTVEVAKEGMQKMGQVSLCSSDVLFPCKSSITSLVKSGLSFQSPTPSLKDDDGWFPVADGINWCEDEGQGGVVSFVY